MTFKQTCVFVIGDHYEVMRLRQPFKKCYKIALIFKRAFIFQSFFNISLKFQRAFVFQSDLTLKPVLRSRSRITLVEQEPEP
jgi:hypothetical protein